MTPRWTPEQLRDFANDDDMRAGLYPAEPVYPVRAEMLRQAADDAEAVARLERSQKSDWKAQDAMADVVSKLIGERNEARAEVARLTAENARLASQNAAIYDQMERTQHQRDEARAIAQRWHERADFNGDDGDDFQSDAATIAGWSNPCKSVVE